MFAVIFEAVPADETKDEYLEIAGKLRDCLQDQQGFISIGDSRAFQRMARS